MHASGMGDATNLIEHMTKQGSAPATWDDVRKYAAANGAKLVGAGVLKQLPARFIAQVDKTFDLGTKFVKQHQDFQQYQQYQKQQQQQSQQQAQQAQQQFQQQFKQFQQSLKPKLGPGPTPTLTFEAEPLHSHAEFYEVDPEVSYELPRNFRRLPGRAIRRRPHSRARRWPRRPIPAFRIPVGFNIFTDTQPFDAPPLDDANAPMATDDAATDDTTTVDTDSSPDLEFNEWEWLGPEMSEMFSEWEDEISRSSKDYIQWVQRSLNQIMGLRLDVDGISGTLARSAVRSFQTRARIAADGIVGSQTEGALIAAGAQPPPGAPPPIKQPLAPLTASEQTEFARLGPAAQVQFNQLRTKIDSYVDVARREADKGSRTLLTQGHFRQTAQLLPELIRLTNITTLPGGWSLAVALPLLVGNVLYNLAFPETINQGGTDRLGGQADPTCFSASTQILLARRFPATYVRLTIQLATTSRATFAGGAGIGPLTFVSTNLYRSLESVLLQTAFDTYFNNVAIVGGNYVPGDELKVHRQVFGATRPPRFTTSASKASMVSAFRTAFVERGGNTRPWEVINLCVGNPSPCNANHSVVLTRVTGGRVYFYNPWANEEEKATMFGAARVSVSGNGERPAESSMTQADFEGQLTSVFHN